MKAKTLILNLIVAAIAIFSQYKGVLTPDVAAWGTAITASLSLILVYFAPSGTWLEGHATIFYIGNGLMCLLGIVHIFNDALILPANITLYATIGLNFVLMTVRNYTDTGK